MDEDQLLEMSGQIRRSLQRSERVEASVEDLRQMFEILLQILQARGALSPGHLKVLEKLRDKAHLKLSPIELNDTPGEDVTPAALKYINRLSDFLFVAGRHAYDRGASDVLWEPGRNR